MAVAAHRTKPLAHSTRLGVRISSGAPVGIKMGTGITGKFWLHAIESPLYPDIMDWLKSQVLCFTQFQA